MTRSADSFVNGKPFVVRPVDLTKRWSGGKPGEGFRCYLCGYKFAVGDVCRWQYTNDVSGAGGNPMVCERCDGTKESIVERWKQMHIDARNKMWWFTQERY